MSDDRICPECKSPLRARARKCACGWQAPSPSAPIGSPGSAYSAPEANFARFRCEWESNGVRCRWPGSCSRATNGGGPLFCFGHLACADTADGGLGQRIVDESIERIGEGGDYSGPGMQVAARRALRERAEAPHKPVPRPPGVHLPAGAHRIGAVLKAHLRPPAEAVRHYTDVDDERNAERAAIQGEA